MGTTYAIDHSPAKLFFPPGPDDPAMVRAVAEIRKRFWPWLASTPTYPNQPAAAPDYRHSVVYFSTCGAGVTVGAAFLRVPGAEVLRVWAGEFTYDAGHVLAGQARNPMDPFDFVTIPEVSKIMKAQSRALGAAMAALIPAGCEARTYPEPDAFPVRSPDATTLWVFGRQYTEYRARKEFS